MKYRILNSEELVHLEEDLKHFLIVNGIHSEEWLQINENEPEKAIQLVELFSDTVLQKVYEKLKFLEFRSTDTCRVFHCLNEKMELISIQKKADSTVDLSTVLSIHDALSKRIEEINFFRSSKNYKESRESEIHLLIEQGCVVSSKTFWDLLNEVLA